MAFSRTISSGSRSLGRLLLRVPFREVWLSVALLLIVGENYPFSNFPMYSSLEEEAVYFVVLNGRGEMLPYVTTFRSRSTYVPKALKAERRKLENEGLSSDVRSGASGQKCSLVPGPEGGAAETSRSLARWLEIDRSANLCGGFASQGRRDCWWRRSFLVLMKFDSQIVPHSSWEMVLMRIAFAAMVWQSVPSFYYPATLSHPNGLAHFLDLTFLMNPEILGTLRGLLAVARRLLRRGIFDVRLAYFHDVLAVGMRIVRKFAGGHQPHPSATCLGGVGPMGRGRIFRWSAIEWSHKRALFPVATAETHRRLVHAAKVALVSCYVTSAITKLERSEGEWLQRTPNLAVAIAKTNTKSYLNIQEPADHLAKAVPQFIIDHPNVTRVFFGLGFALELFSFLALLGRWPAVLIGVSLICMHDMIARVMDLHFAIFERLAFIFLVNVPWLAALALGAIWNLERSLDARTCQSPQRAGEHLIDLVLDSGKLVQRKSRIRDYDRLARAGMLVNEQAFIARFDRTQDSFSLQDQCENIAGIYRSGVPPLRRGVGAGFLHPLCEAARRGAVGALRTSSARRKMAEYFRFVRSRPLR